MLRRFLRTWLTIAAAAGLVAIVALASRTTSVATSAMELDTTGFVLTVIEVVGYVAVIVGVVVALPTFIVLRLQQRRRLAAMGAGRGAAPWWAKVAGLAMTLTILIAQIAIVVYLVELLRSQGAGTTDGALEPATGPDPNALGTGRDGSSLMIALAIVTVMAIVAVVLVIRWRRSDAADQAEGDDRRDRTEQAVEVGLDALRREPDPRRAIIAAYAAMERSLSQSGFGRHAWEAPIEYLRRVLAGAVGAAEDVQTMTQLFQVAKFSQHAVDESMRSSAIGALERIRTATRASSQTAASQTAASARA